MAEETSGQRGGIITNCPHLLCLPDTRTDCFSRSFKGVLESRQKAKISIAFERISEKRPLCHFSSHRNRTIKSCSYCTDLLGGNFLLQKDDQMESFPSFQTLYVPAGQRAELVLPDSTKVWLNANSKLVYPTSFKEGIRQVELDGEAYFDVKHNGDNPFVVRTKSMNVTVLGTEFNVSAYSGIEEFNIALLRGSVELNSSDRSGKYRMKAGEQIFYREGKYVSAQIGNMDYFKWKEGVLSFNNQPIHVIIDKLRLYYDIRIEVADLPFLEERYSGQIPSKGRCRTSTESLAVRA